MKLYFACGVRMTARIKVSSGGTVIFEGKPRAFKPSIMESMPLTPKMMQQAHGTITFSVEPVEDEGYARKGGTVAMADTQALQFHCTTCPSECLLTW